MSAGGVVRVGMAPRLAGLSPEAFQAHWRSDHADAAGAIPGVRSYVQNHAVLVDGRPVLPYPGFDACAELDFDDLDAMHAGFSSPHYRGAVREDEDRFVDTSGFSRALCRREAVLDRGAAADPVKLLWLWRAHPVGGRRALLAAAARWADVVADDPSVRRHERLEVVDAWHEGRRPPACDHIDVLWFDGLDDALAHLGAAAQEAALRMAGGAFGCAGHLARPRRIV